MMGFLADLKMRHKMLAVLSPLALMVLAGSLYATSQMERIDAHYSDLIANEGQAVTSLSRANQRVYRFGLLLNQMAMEQDADQAQRLDAEADVVSREATAYVADGVRQAQRRATSILAAAALFDNVVLDSRVVRARVLANNRVAAGAGLSNGLMTRLEAARLGMTAVIDDLRRDIDTTSNRLTEETHRTILLTWMGVVLGLIGSLAAALSIAQRGVVDVLEDLQDSIRDVAEGNNDRPVPHLHWPNEIGAIARALNILKGVAGERETQAWVKAEVAATVERLQSCEDFSAFASALMSRIAEMAPLFYGAFYLSEQEGRRFVRVGGFALDAPGEPRSFAPGEGLVGQVALSGRGVTVDTLTADTIHVAIGMGTIEPRHLAIMPVVDQATVVAVLELAPVAPFSQRQRALLEALLSTVALNAKILAGTIATRKLLEETQIQAASLAASERQLAARKLELEGINQQVAEAEERSRLILASVEDGICGLGTDGRMSFVNPAGARMLGYSPEELVGQMMHPLLHHTRADGTAFPREECPMYHTTRDGTVRTVSDEVLWRKNGTSFPVEYSATPVHKDGEVVGSVVSFRDITTRKAAERALRDAKDLAEAASQAKASFLANMSHEIRTPMNAIIGMSHLALKTELTPRQKDYLRKIQQSGQHLLGVINDILDISKIEAGKFTVEKTEVRLDKVMENVANLISDKAAAKGLELVFDISPEVPNDLIGDPLRLGQVLINYANNAVKFTETGEIAIVARQVEDLGETVTLRFEVRDTGIGLSDEQKERLFQNFQQADSSTTRKYGGSGLGLAISKKLVELMDGAVGVDSEPGKGSVFWFTARFGKGRPRRALMPKPDLRGRRMLVVDDNETARIVLADLLTSMSFDVESVPSGVEAIAAVRNACSTLKPFDIVFLDWQMPGLDGLETAAKIVDLRLAPNPHLIMVTAYGREDMLKGAEEVGIEEVLIKPVNASTLFDAAMRALGGDDADEIEGAAPARGEGDLSLVKGMRVLLVEDNNVNQQVASEILVDGGVVVELAENGKVAVDKVDAGGYDAILMDMQMPVMDGIDATRAIRGRGHGLPIIAMTANAMSADRDRCLDAGMNDYVAKPIDPDHLFEVLAKWRVGPVAEVGESPSAGRKRARRKKEPARAPRPDLPEIDPDIFDFDRMGPIYKWDVARLKPVLAGFLDDAGLKVAALDMAVGASDGSLPTVAHALKGAANTAGAVRLGRLAADIESAARAGQTDVVAMLEPLVAPTLTELRNALSTFLTQGAP